MSKPEHSKSVQSYCFFLICAIGCSFCHNNPIKIGQVKVKTKTPYESFSIQTRMYCPTTTLPLLSLIPLLYLFFSMCVRDNYARLITFLISISSPYNQHRPTNNKMHPTSAFYYALLIGCKNI